MCGVGIREEFHNKRPVLLRQIGTKAEVRGIVT
jgi:hypothetical protein